MVSGESGEDHRFALERAWETGVAPRPWKFDGASHVELKLASRMHDVWRRTGEPQHETLVINNRPCDVNPLDCDGQLIGARAGVQPRSAQPP